MYIIVHKQSGMDVFYDPTLHEAKHEDMATTLSRVQDNAP